MKLYLILGQDVDDGYLSAKIPALARKNENKTNVKIKKITTKTIEIHFLLALPILVNSKFSQSMSEGSLQILTSASSPNSSNG